ncbi:classical arabinogalactan protein 4 [Artemisia annua]|uniref:Classical arabinogalactan protein 4 n=1 Tax=Artemisia annua TaxID=35608 RepID=A0A2U1KQV4_ARTAN|nr:classical arabinogalactan protein 4 [Artemisia annua]
MAYATMYQLFMLLALFATSCITQSPVGAPTVSTVATPIVAPTLVPPTPSPAPVLALTPAGASPTLSRMYGPSPSPSSLAPTFLTWSLCRSCNSTWRTLVDVPDSSYANTWVNRVVIAGTAFAGSFIVVTFM